MRWTYVASVANQLDLAPDAQAFLGILAEARHPFDMEFREPLFLWLIWLARKALSPTNLAIQFLNSLIGAGALALAWIVGRRLGSAACGVAGMAALGMSRELWYHGARGLRPDVYIAGLLLLVLTLWVEPGRSSWRRAAAAGAVAGALALIQIMSLPVSAAMLLWFGWRRRWNWTRLAAAGALALALASPYFWHIRRLKGDFFYESRRVATYYRDLELGDAAQQRQSASNRLDGQSVSLGQYIFGYHSLGEVARRTARGL
ncbi:MAG: glycosyltransferase family 39 protein, partial [Candidatus Sumerlaeota bacterium]|nr:glycosyltransferase family 39 protein [Candidatus Sumerlaeota bacterium]